MATLVWQDVSGMWSSSSNWRDVATGSNAAPADGDTLIVGSQSQVIVGSDESATKLERVLFGDGCGANIASAGSRLKLAADSLNWSGLSPAAFIDLGVATVFTDLAIDGSDNTKVTSAARDFTDADVGKTLEVTGGTGFTTGVYTVESIVGVAAILDAAVGTTGSTGGTGFFYVNVYVKRTATIEADEIATKGLHLRLYGVAPCENLKVLAGYGVFEVTVGDDAVWIGDIKLAGALLHIDGVGGGPLATSINCLDGGKVVAVGDSGLSALATIVVEENADFSRVDAPVSFPLTGPIVIVRGTLSDWDSAVPIGNLVAERGLTDFSRAKQPFDVQQCTIIDGSVNIQNGIRQPRFPSGVLLRGRGQLIHDANIDIQVNYAV